MERLIILTIVMLTDPVVWPAPILIALIIREWWIAAAIAAVTSGIVRIILGFAGVYAGSRSPVTAIFACAMAGALIAIATHFFVKIVRSDTRPDKTDPN